MPQRIYDRKSIWKKNKKKEKKTLCRWRNVRSFRSFICIWTMRVCVARLRSDTLGAYSHSLHYRMELGPSTIHSTVSHRFASLFRTTYISMLYDRVSRRERGEEEETTHQKKNYKKVRARCHFNSSIARRIKWWIRTILNAFCACSLSSIIFGDSALCVCVGRFGSAVLVAHSHTTWSTRRAH